jgi:hypothetical protein
MLERSTLYGSQKICISANASLNRTQLKKKSHSPNTMSIQMAPGGDMPPQGAVEVGDQEKYRDDVIETHDGVCIIVSKIHLFGVKRKGCLGDLKIQVKLKYSKVNDNILYMYVYL